MLAKAGKNFMKNLGFAPVQMKRLALEWNGTGRRFEQNLIADFILI